MREVRAWLLRLWGQFNRDRSDKEFAEEIETHLQMQIEDNLRSGMNPGQARREALVKSGGMEVTMQAHRDGTTLPLLETLYQDLRYTIRLETIRLEQCCPSLHSLHALCKPCYFSATQ